MGTEVELRRDAGAPPRRPQADDKQRRLVVRCVELVAVARFLGSRGFIERAIVGAIGLAALADLAREKEARTARRLAAWNRRRSLAASGARRRAAG